MSFLKSFFASLLALVLFTTLVVILFIIWVGVVASEKQVMVKENAVLHLKLDAEITELQEENPLEGLPLPGGDVRNIGLMQLKQAIAHAKDDGNIKGIYIEASHPQAGFATLEEIRESLLDFRESGKWVVSYDEVMTEGAYYLATASDEIFMNPEGDIEFNGLTITVSFFKRLFDTWQIKPQIFRVGEFKSAVEPFMLEEMSPENETQLTSLANSIYDHMLEQIGVARSMDKARLEEISDNMMVRNAAIARELGLVDSLLYEDEFHDNLRAKLGLEKEAKINFVTYNDYRKSFSEYNRSANEIAVIVAEGTIMPGEGDQQDKIIGAETFTEELRKARTRDDVKAIIIRINSPGGEFRASDMMWREIQLAVKEKPVIASMADYAASGGYYLAMACDTIVAQPHTITGSIGIFGMMFDLSGFMGNKIGITFDEVRTGQFGEMYTVTRPLSEAERRYWQKNLDEHYETFTTKAAQGRDMPLEELKKVASGRVWTGAQGVGNKLVDIEGSFNDAVTVAAKAAGVEDDYKVKFYPEQKSFLEEWLAGRQENTKNTTIKKELGEYYIFYQQWQKIKTYQGAQARLPFEIQLH